ncbi:hypothetical protein D6851_14575 [Altericroceibacterium spongiae]|uniref:Uncharacterized protein n=1 Tax=Altericroceibacterium spongiae TaxID=2320269 RepID=A0A420ECJ4_9SPHN|nr:hypothetical protein D6851_14575 [Altericroceibacterium spongiae]
MAIKLIAMPVCVERQIGNSFSVRIVDAAYPSALAQIFVKSAGGRAEAGPDPALRGAIGGRAELLDRGTKKTR